MDDKQQNLPDSGSESNATSEQAGTTYVAPRPRTGVLRNEQGLRSGWRLLIYLAILICLAAGISLAVRFIVHPVPGTMASPRAMMLGEIVSFFCAFFAAWVMSRIEGRPLGVYGLPGKGAFGGLFWFGFVMGLVEICLLVGLIAGFGGYRFGELALNQSGILHWGLFYLIFFVFVGLFEEFLFRGYTQFTLADGIGFWPAAIVLSVIFGLAHRSNPGEGYVGLISVMFVGMLFAFTLKRTGNIWYAVGLHASFDWGETFLFSVPNSGTVMPGHLSNSIIHGAKWLTGGTVGPEGSVFCFLTIALQILFVHVVFPAKPKDYAASSSVINPA